MQACVAVDAMQSKRWLRSVITATTASIPPSAFSAAGSVSPVFFTNSFASLNQKGQAHQLACSVKSSLQVLTTSHALPKSSLTPLTPLPPQASFAAVDRAPATCWILLAHFKIGSKSACSSMPVPFQEDADKPEAGNGATWNSLI